jgi:hypothetical protein
VIPHKPPGLLPEEPMLKLDSSEHPIRQVVLTETIEHRVGRVTVPSRPGVRDQD